MKSLIIPVSRPKMQLSPEVFGRSVGQDRPIYRNTQALTFNEQNAPPVVTPNQVAMASDASLTRSPVIATIGGFQVTRNMAFAIGGLFIIRQIAKG